MFTFPQIYPSVENEERLRQTGINHHVKAVPEHLNLDADVKLFPGVCLSIREE